MADGGWFSKHGFVAPKEPTIPRTTVDAHLLDVAVRIDARTMNDSRMIMHMVMPNGETVAFQVERLPQWVTEDNTKEIERTERHEADDRLPRSRAELLASILSANRVTDHDSAQADTLYLAWKLKRGPKPTGDLGGMLDGFDCSTDSKRKPCCLLEAFERDTKGAVTWRDILPVLPKLADALKLETVVLPDDVIDRHIAQDAEVML